ncbi:MAG: hypothetical protein CFE32_12860 [Alphaproteobacteria bacterium PA3]|nr:MAG: hypothetical protein CFE32_12860 [Alphaproteobacteria bacterium PA3]
MISPTIQRDIAELPKEQAAELGTIRPPANHALPGIDYLRAGFMLSVVFGHANFALYWATVLADKTGPGPNLMDVFYFQVQSTAVPTFILVSILLFCLKPITFARTRSRLVRLGYLYLFWVSAWMYYTKPVIEWNVLWITEFLLRGGGWQFYFIPVLILMTMQAAWMSRLTRRGVHAAFLASVLILFATEWWATSDFRWTRQPYYWLPACFVLLPCFAYWLASQIPTLVADRTKRFRIAGLLALAALVAAMVEWRFQAPADLVDQARKWVPKHARFSIQFESLAIVVLSLGIRRPPGPVIAYLARNALGIYCLHGFVIGGFLKSSQQLLGGKLPALVIPVACAGVVVACSLTSEFLRRAFRYRLV